MWIIMTIYAQASDFLYGSHCIIDSILGMSIDQVITIYKSHLVV
jgi:hypothetical protein